MAKTAPWKKLRRRAPWRIWPTDGLAALLAALALVLTPALPGAAPGTAVPGGASIVICTANGPITVPWPGGDDAPPQPPGADCPACQVPAAACQAAPQAAFALTDVVGVGPAWPVPAAGRRTPAGWLHPGARPRPPPSPSQN